MSLTEASYAAMALAVSFFTEASKMSLMSLKYFLAALFASAGDLAVSDALKNYKLSNYIKIIN